MMHEMTDAQFKRLPRYAQSEIRRLRMNLQEARDKIAERNCVKDDQPHAMIDPYSQELSETRPITTHVGFYPEGRRANVFFTVKLTDKGELEVYCDSLVVIKPTSGNIITIERKGW